MATTTDTDALLAEMDTFLAECAAIDARVEALLAQPVVLSLTSQLAALQALSAENTAALDAIEAEQTEIERQIEALEQAA